MRNWICIINLSSANRSGNFSSPEEDCPGERFNGTLGRVLHYGTSEIDLRVAVFHSNFYFFICFLFRVLLHRESIALLRRPLMSRYRLCPPARPFRVARFMVGAAVPCKHRESRWTIIRYNRDNEIVRVTRHVRTLTDEYPSNAVSPRSARRAFSLIQRENPALVYSSARSFIISAAVPIVVWASHQR